MTAPKCPCPSFELHGEATAYSPVPVCTCRHTADEHDEHGECQGRLPVGVVTQHGKEVIDLGEWWLRHGDLETAFRELRDQGMTYEEIAEAIHLLQNGRSRHGHADRADEGTGHQPPPRRSSTIERGRLRNEAPPLPPGSRQDWCSQPLPVDISSRATSTPPSAG